MTQDASCGWVHTRMSPWGGGNAKSRARTFVRSGVKRLRVGAFTCTTSLLVSAVWGLTSVESCEVKRSFLRNLQAITLRKEESGSVSRAARGRAEQGR